MKMQQGMLDETEVPHSTLTQRRWLVVGSALAPLYLILAHFIAAIGSVQLYVLFGVVIIISFVCQYRLYRLNTTRIASMSDREVDERQKMVRDRAYRSAYRLLTLIIGLALPFVLLFSSSAYVPLFFLSYVSLLWFMVLLPTWVIAWTEKDG
jgi:hypothetical protein